MRLRFHLSGVAVATAIVSSGCDGVTDGTACTLEARAGVTVDIRDSISNADVSSGARIIAKDGVYADTVNSGGAGFPVGLAYERSGTYTVTVEKNGYRTWSQGGVVVTKDQCHVQGVSLVARMQQ